MSINTPQVSLVEAAFRLGVPTFILVLGMYLMLPRIDSAIAVANRVDSQLTIIAASCDVRARGI